MIYYAVSIFISAFLLFQIQPMISKYILPWFGGTPAVWSTSLLFFQILLTGGYAYAYWLIGKHRSRMQGLIHIALLTISLGTLILTALTWSSPITPDSSWKPQGVEMPILQVLKLLVVAVGIPYFLLATNSTLMQAWFNRDHPGRSPYRLYALSNIGSLLALVSYPVLVEPFLTLRTQGSLWSLGYGGFALLSLFGAYRTLKWQQADSPQKDAEIHPKSQEPTLFVKTLWGLLPASASILLLAVTNHITQEVAAIPFLWVLPLTIYLLSFILTFESKRWYSWRWYSLALVVISAVVIWMMLWRPRLEYVIELAIYASFLFVSCMVAHGELVKLRPSPDKLTSFYLMVSIGGALGGVFVNLIAPYIFSGYFELQWGILFIWILLFIVTVQFKPVKESKPIHQGSIAVLGILAVLVGYYMSVSVSQHSLYSLYEARNYYGILRVNEMNADNATYHAYNLVHGKINHGFQFISPEMRREPTAYFTQDSGIGITYLNHPQRPGALKVGVLGLGIGAQAAYNQSGDSFRFYEINPVVVDLAQGEGGFFSYLEDAPGETSVVLGDARLSLELELERGENQNFDLLVLDAFTSDSIPVHLITREAFVLYLQHLNPEGILAIDITNKHLNLVPVVQTLAREFGLYYAIIENEGDGLQSSYTLWAILSRKKDFIESEPIQSRNQESDTASFDFRLWTDDYSNLFTILK